MYAYAENNFYPFTLKNVYESAGSWPAEFVEVGEDEFKSFSGAPPTGKMRGADSKGLPCWVDIPPPTQEELSVAAEKKKSVLLAEASAIIAPLRDASDGGYIDDADKPKLTAWQKYRYELTKVDPANPIWPDKPAV